MYHIEDIKAIIKEVEDENGYDKHDDEGGEALVYSGFQECIEIIKDKFGIK